MDFAPFSRAVAQRFNRSSQGENKMSDKNNLFELASIHKYRFPASIGELTLEQIYDLPLDGSKNGVDLDTIARTINTALKSEQEESFVKPKSTSRSTELSNKLELVKRVIEYKQNLAENARRRQAKAELRRKYLDALAAADSRDLANATRDELEKKLADLDSED